jgi:hypothetical protein
VVFTLYPSTGVDYFGIYTYNGTAWAKTTTPVIRLQWAYDGGGTTNSSSKDLANVETGLAFARNTDGSVNNWTDAALSAIPNQGKWKIELFSAGNTGPTPDEIQYSTTLSRPPTLTEVKSYAWASLADAVRTAIAPKLSVGGIPLTDAAGSFVDIGTAAAGDAGWQVPANALAPTSLNILGRFFRTGTISSTNADSYQYTDGNSVYVTDRYKRGVCTNLGASDAHCISSGANTGAYKANNLIQQFELWAKSERGVERSHMHAMYQRIP